MVHQDRRGDSDTPHVIGMSLAMELFGVDQKTHRGPLPPGLMEVSDTVIAVMITGQVHAEDTPTDNLEEKIEKARRAGSAMMEDIQVVQVDTEPDQGEALDG